MSCSLCATATRPTYLRNGAGVQTVFSRTSGVARGMLVAMVCTTACGGGTDTSVRDVDSVVAPTCNATEAQSGVFHVGESIPQAGSAPTPVEVTGSERQLLVSDAALRDVSLAPATAPETSPEIRYTFAGDGQIGWSARYTAQPLRHNSSEAVPVVGTCVLQVDFTAYPTDVDGNLPADQSRLTAPGLDGVVEVVTFPPTVKDAVTQSFIGLRSDSPDLRFESVRDHTFVVSVRSGK